MNVSLPPELEKFVQDKVEAGHYPTAGEVVRDALWLLREHDRFRQARANEIREQIQIGLDELDRGEGAPLDIVAVKAEARRRRAKGQNAS